MQAPRWLDAREAGAWRGFMQMHGQLSGALGRELLHDSGLSMQDYAVLVVLSEAPEGTMRAFELGRALGWEKSRLSHHIARMSRRDLVSRRRCPSDQRGAFVVLTPHGREAIEAAAPGHLRAVRRLFVDVLTPGELETLSTVARKVIAGLECSEG